LLRDRLLAERETPWRRAAGLILLTGILSLVSSFGPVDETRVAGVAGETAKSAAAMRGSMMEEQDPAGTVDRPIGMTIGIARLPHTEEGSFHREVGVSPVQRRTGPAGAAGLLARLESAIQRYPWPTLALGVGVGYFLARRLR
jgi:hypothetical protein